MFHSERLADYISILDTLGELRDLNQIIKNKANHMSLHFDKTKTFLFNDGRIEGKDEKLEEIVRSIYAEGDMTIAKIAKICHISEEEVLAILSNTSNRKVRWFIN